MALQDRSILIIGGTSGIGLAAAHAFLEAGANVTALGLDNPLADEAERQLTTHNRPALVLRADATQPDTPAHAVEATLRRFGKLHALYHVAGGSGRPFGDGPLHTLTPDAIQQTLNLNLLSVFHSNRAVTRHFLEADQPGAILNLTSVLAYSPAPAHFATHAYAAAKAAVIGLTVSAAAHYAPHNIRFNALAPGLIETPMAQRAASDPAILEYIRQKQPLDGGRLGTPRDLTHAALFLLSDQSRFITGQTLAVDGGWSLSEPTPDTHK